MDGMNDLSIMMLFFDYLASSTQDVHFNFVVVDELSCRYNVASHNGRADYGGIGTIVFDSLPLHGRVFSLPSKQIKGDNRYRERA